MSDYPRDLVNKAGAVREFKSKEEVPPGWFVRDTGEEVNPQAVDAPADLAPPKKKGKHAPVDPLADEQDPVT